MCNIANQMMALSMTMLSACWAVYFWNFFEIGYGNVDVYKSGGKWRMGFVSCAENDGMDLSLCQMFAAGGTLSVLAALVAAGGGLYVSFQKNQAHMSAAFSLLNLAAAVFFFVIVKDFTKEGQEKLNSDADFDDLKDLSEELYFVCGLLHAFGFLFGILYTLCIRCELCIKESWQISRQKNNFNYVFAMFLYLVAQAIFKYRQLDNSSCSTNVSDLSESMKEELDAQMDGEHKFDESKHCVSLAFSGTFLAIGALACFIGLILSFCQEAARQGRVQQFSLAFSVAMACAAWSSQYWYDYSASGISYHTFEPSESCSDQDFFSTGRCAAAFCGGLFSIIGFPLAFFTSFAFLCGCMADLDENVVVIASNRGHVV